MKFIPNIVLLFLIFILSSGCSSGSAEQENLTSIKDEDVVAVVKGKEITLKEIRSLHVSEEQDIRMMVERFIQQEVIILEAKSIGINVEDEVEIMELMFPLGSTGNEDYLESQADYLGVSVEEYYEVYFKRRMEREAYFNRLMEEEFNLSHYVEDDEELLNKKIDIFIKSLLKKYEEDIEVLL